MPMQEANEPKQIPSKPAAASFFSITNVTEARKAEILHGLTEGAYVSLTYYILLGLATLIAAFGLIANSPAVVIGAMLVSPLMTPMFGAAVGLTRGDMVLLGRSVAAVFAGAALSVLLGFIIGIMPFALEVTPEMLARTRPTLIDLLVAALAGLAGCFSWIDERASPVLPGVAIATALVPPLATSGLGLAFGSYEGAWGAFLLFLANFLTIVAVSATIFLLFGFVRRHELGTGKQVYTRFLSAGAGLLAVGVLLTFSLISVVDDWRVRRTITFVMEQELADDPNTGVTEIAYDRILGTDGLSVLAIIRTPRVLAPYKVEALEKTLADALREDVNLFVRCVLTRDVASTGSAELLVKLNLDGSITKGEPHPDVRIVYTAEQLIREIIGPQQDVFLEDVEFVRFDAGPVVIATLRSQRSAVPIEVAFAEQLLRDRTGNEKIRLLVRGVVGEDVTNRGQILFGRAHFTDDEAARSRADNLTKDTRRLIEAAGDYFVIDSDAVETSSGWRIRATVAGPTIFSPADVAAIETRLTDAFQTSVSLEARWIPELIVTATGYETIRARLEKTADQWIERTAPEFSSPPNLQIER